jgi:hypothetical protein
MKTTLIRYGHSMVILAVLAGTALAQDAVQSAVPGKAGSTDVAAG